MNEDDFSKFLRVNFKGWIERVEIARGMHPGYPDISALLAQGMFNIELKVGTTKNGTLWPKEVRPSQIQWHKRLADEGGSSFFLVGVADGKSWKAYAFDGVLARFWDTVGYKIGEQAIEIDTKDLFGSLSSYVSDYLEN